MSKDIELDFQYIFQNLPQQHLLLTPKLIMVAATEAYYAITHTKPEVILNRYVFDVFPENKDTEKAGGVSRLAASFQRAIDTKEADTLPLQRYDFPLPENEGGGFAVGWWRIVNTPLLNNNHEVVFILNTVEDVTHMVGVLEEAQNSVKNR